MRQPLIDVKTLFANKVEEMEKERENVVKSRIESFYSRHKRVRSDDDFRQQREAKQRPLWG